MTVILISDALPPEILTLVEFQLEDGISDEDAMRMIELSDPDASSEEESSSSSESSDDEKPVPALNKNHPKVSHCCHQPPQGQLLLPPTTPRSVTAATHHPKVSCYCCHKPPQGQLLLPQTTPRSVTAATNHPKVTVTAATNHPKINYCCHKPSYGQSLLPPTTPRLVTTATNHPRELSPKGSSVSEPPAVVGVCS